MRYRITTATRPLAVALALLGALALGGAAAAAGASALAIEAKDGWIRWLPAGLPSAGYVTLTNEGAADIELVGAGSTDFADVGMHQSREEHGMSEMRPVASVVLRAHTTLRFAEGGYHLMLMGPKRALHPGDTVTIVFRSSGGGAISIPFEVRGPGSAAEPGH